MIRIRAELPQLTRCCVCLPLRYGLIVWGYIRLAIGVLLLVGISESFYKMIKASKTEAAYNKYVVWLGFFLILTAADIMLSILFIIGAHKKNLKLLKAYYIYNLTLWILMVIMGIFGIAYSLYLIKLWEMSFLHGWFLLCEMTTYIAQMFIQAYVLLLVRSEIIKLTNNREFRFVNNAAESACKMKCAEDVLANGNSEEVYKNGLSEAKDTMTY